MRPRNECAILRPTSVDCLRAERPITQNNLNFRHGLSDHRPCPPRHMRDQVRVPRVLRLHRGERGCSRLRGDHRMPGWDGRVHTWVGRRVHLRAYAMVYLLIHHFPIYRASNKHTEQRMWAFGSTILVFWCKWLIVLEWWKIWLNFKQALKQQTIKFASKTVARDRCARHRVTARAWGILSMGKWETFSLMLGYIYMKWVFSTSIISSDINFCCQHSVGHVTAIPTYATLQPPSPI